jgi:methionyl-tRNA formyltransferase
MRLGATRCRIDDFSILSSHAPCIFAGTPEFARVALERLHAAGFDVALVLTQPDRPAGRGMKLQASPVKQWAQAQGIARGPAAQPAPGRQVPDDAAAAQQALQQRVAPTQWWWPPMA